MEYKYKKISLTKQEVETLQNAINYLLLGNNSTPDERKVLNEVMEKMK